MRVFEVACVVIVVATLALMARRQTQGWRALLPTYLALAVAGWIGESTCIAWYEHYHYSQAWDARIGAVPLLVPLIWPLVILSARDVVTQLWPKLDRARPLAVGALVIFDASLVEVIAVHAELWQWAEPGHLGVPIIGILGWGYFAAAAEAITQWARPQTARGGVALVALAPLGAHALIQLSWWGGLRWVARGELGAPGLVGVVAVGVLGAAIAIRARRAGAAIPASIAAPRMVAAGLFLALLTTVSVDLGALWLHTAAVAVPYLIATDWRSFTSKGSPADPPATTTPSPPRTT